jgi:hypothetical protein
MRFVASRFVVLRLIATVLLVAGGWPAAAHAQSSIAAKRVVVAVPDSFPDKDASLVVIRYRASDQPDLILLNSAKMSWESLAVGMAVLRKGRATNPAPPADEVTAVHGFASDRRSTPAFQAKVQSIVARLQSQPPAKIGNLGRGRWIDLP